MSNKFRIIIVLSSLIVIGLFANYAYYNIKYSKYDWYVMEMNLHKTWRKTKGEGSTIAILDSGVTDDYLERFSNNITEPYNVIDDNTNITDTSGHGSSLICLILCDFNTDEVEGIAKESKVIPILVVDSSGRTEDEYIAKGIDYAISKEATIINISLGSKLENPLTKEAIKRAEEKDIIVVGAVGDYEEELVLFPARDSSVVAVQAQSKLGVKYLKASYGDDVTVRIPGEFIKTYSIDSENNNFEIEYKSGSSFASIIFSGICALHYSFNKDINMLKEDIKQITVNENFFDTYEFIK